MMNWLPATIKNFNELISQHEFAGGVLFACFFIWLMRHYFFRSSERLLEEQIKELKAKCKKLEKALELEQHRVKQCHAELEACRKSTGEK